jgi:ribonuclease BN (tRNA processing enzyme)
MKIVFMGVGSAMDENYPNTSILVEGETKLLLDCGFDVASQVWKYNPDQEFLDAVWISHLHGDHFFGIPHLLIRMREEKRKKPLKILGPPGTKESVIKAIDLAYPGGRDTAGFELKFLEFERKTKLNELDIEIAENYHPVKNFSIRISAGGKSFCYSGDGNYSEGSKKLFEGADLVVHEAFLPDKEIQGHASIQGLLKMKGEVGIKKLAFVHLNNDFRKSGKAKSFLKKDVILPEPMQEIEL